VLLKVISLIEVDIVLLERISIIDLNCYLEMSHSISEMNFDWLEKSDLRLKGLVMLYLWC